MQIWRYAWTIAPLSAATALGVALRGQEMNRLGWIFILLGLLGLLLVVLKEWVERPERAHAFYRVDGPQAIYCYSYVEFMRLPANVRGDCLHDQRVAAWFTAEVHRHGVEMFQAYGTRRGKAFHHIYTWLLNFLA